MMRNMDRVIELELTLLNGDRLYLCDRVFKVHSETRKNYDAETDYSGSGVNGFAVIEEYDQVVSTIKKLKGCD